MDDGPSAREELAEIAAALRAYLEAQRDSGATGLPRAPRVAPRAGTSASPASANPADDGHDDAAYEDAPYEPPGEGGAWADDEPPAPAPRAPAPKPVPRPLPDFLLSADDPRPYEPAQTAPRPTSALDGSPAKPAAPARPLPVVEAEVKTCTKCGLAPTRTTTVFARGNAKARVAFVGEAPGADEDAQGIPFVGRAGQLLDKMIVAGGLDPEADVYVCNIVKCRPPANRRPEPDEIDACIPYLHEQLAQVEPEVIVAMGNTAVAALLGTKLGITKVRGSWKLYKGMTKVMPTYHPSYLLRPSPTQAEAKRQAWDDLKLVMKHLGLKGKPKA